MPGRYNRIANERLFEACARLEVRSTGSSARAHSAVFTGF
jgi:hypothetical protein